MPLLPGASFILDNPYGDKVQRFGLYDSYVTNESVLTNIKSILALAFLPVYDVGYLMHLTS